MSIPQFRTTVPLQLTPESRRQLMLLAKHYRVDGMGQMVQKLVAREVVRAERKAGKNG